MTEHIIDHNADFVLFSETWLPLNSGFIKSHFQSINYNFFHKPRDNRKGGGVGILALKTYTLNTLNLGVYDSFEYCSYSLKHNSGDKIILLSIYRPPHNSISDFFTHFTSALEVISTINAEVYIAGDVNIHLDQISANSRKFNDVISSFNLVQHVNFSTHKHGHTIDVIITSNSLSIKNISAENLFLSDHFLLTSNIAFSKHDPEYKYISRRNFRNFDLDNFHTELTNCLQLTSFDDSSFKQSIDLYDSMCISVLNKHAPIKTKRVKIVPNAPWFDFEYSSLRRLRRRAEKRYSKTKLLCDKERFVALRKETTNLARQKKIIYYSNKIASSNNNTKQLYNVVNDLLSKNNEKIYPSSTSDSELCNKFSNFFTDKIKTLRESFINSSNCPINNIGTLINDNKTNNNFNNNNINLKPQLNIFSQTTVDELRIVIKKSGFSFAPNDPLPPSILKHEIEFFLPIWCLLINKSLSSGNFDGLKESIILPLIKDKTLDQESLKNYRPISNLPFIEKLAERVVLDRLNTYMTQHNFHIPNQFGYKRSHSTEALLIRVVNDILVASDKNSATVLLLLDLSAAFDTVDHSKLLSILRNELGISGSAFNWLKSYITSRTSRVKIGNSYSDSVSVDYGVPQGSVLGPILFNIYLRSLYQRISGINFSVEGFADDHQIFRHFIPIFQKSVLHDEIDNCLNLVQNWMQEYFLKLNPDKTNIILFCPSKYLQDRLIINGTFINNKKTCIRFVDNAKNLGVLFDKYLNFELHINKIISFCFQTIKCLSKIRPYLTVNHLKILISSLVLSKLDYCNSLLYGINTTQINTTQLGKLQSVQNASAKLIFGRRKFDHVSDLFNRLHWLRINQRIAYKIILLVHNSIFLKSFPTHTKSLISVLNSRTMILTIPYMNSSLGKRSFSYIGPKMWNILPTDLRLNDDIDSFKKLLKTYLFSNYDNFLNILRN